MSNRPDPQTFQLLLVEDNPGDVYLFRQALQGAALDFELTVIEDGIDALSFARGEGKYVGRHVPDLAVLDLNLPRAGGIEVLGAVRQSNDLHRMAVVIMTSSGHPREQAIAMQLGVERFITKPPNLEEFLQIGHIVKEVLLKITARRPA